MNLFTIPNPCHENWSEMEPNAEGRFCGSCQKTVVDFTRFSDQELIAYFEEQRPSQRVCGQFNPHQVGKNQVVIPDRVLYSKKISFRDFFVLCFLIAFSSGISCYSQTLKGDVKVITEEGQNRKTLGEPSVPTQELMGKVVSQEFTPKGELIYTFVEQEPLPTVEGTFESYVISKITDSRGVEGKAFVTFLIDSKGKVVDPKIVRHSFASDEIPQQIVEVLMKMPDWKPGLIHGKPVIVRVTMPITFKK